MSTNAEWRVFIESDKTVRNYFCTECKVFSGLMHTRTVTDRDGNTHREYKVVCQKCSKTGPLHWSKSLSEFSWQAINPNFDNNFISKPVEEMKKKG